MKWVVWLSREVQLGNHFDSFGATWLPFVLKRDDPGARLASVVLLRGTKDSPSHWLLGIRAPLLSTSCPIIMPSRFLHDVPMEFGQKATLQWKSAAKRPGGITF